jgi:glycerol-3-phosphate acyltransferase PlsY
VDIYLFFSIFLCCLPVQYLLNRSYQWVVKNEGTTPEARPWLKLFPAHLFVILFCFSEYLLGYFAANLAYSSYANTPWIVMALVVGFFFHLHPPLLGFKKNPYYHLFFLGLASYFSLLTLPLLLLTYLISLLLFNSISISNVVSICSVFISFFLLSDTALLFVVLGWFFVYVVTEMTMLSDALNHNRDSLLNVFNER